MSFLNKRVEDSIKQAKLLAQMSEMSYRSLNGTRQTRSSFINNDLKEQPDTDKPAVGSLTSEMIAQYKREQEEQNKYVDPSTGDEFQFAPAGIAPTLKAPALVPVSSLGAPATVADVETEKNNYDTILQNLRNKKKERKDKIREGKEKEKQVTELDPKTDKAQIATLTKDIATLLTEVKNIQNVDIPPLETALEQSEKDIEMLKDNIKENEIIVRDQEKENKQKLKEYQDTFNIMNKNRYQVTQDPTETDADFIARIQSLEKLAFDPNIFKDRAATEGNKKFMKNLKDITRDEVKISEIVKSFPSPEEVFLINSNWPYILNILKRQFGFNNPGISASEYKSEIDEALDSVQTGKTTNITVQAPSTTVATPGPPATPGPGAPATTPGLANDIPDDTGAPSGFQYEEDDNSLVILNPKGDIVYIKIAESKTLKKILFSKTDNNQGSFKAFNFTNTSGELSFKQFKTDFFGTNTYEYNQMFGADLNYIKIYDYLKRYFSLTDINKGDLKKVQHEGKTIVGYGLKTESIPDICHFGKNIILLKKLYYNNILSVKNKKMHAIEYFTNVKVSDNFVDVILQMCKNSKPNINNLTQDEKQLLDTLLHVCGIKSSANSSKKDDVINELKNKFKLAEGQLRAGNNNPLVIKELKDILKKLTLYNVVTLKNSKDYLKQF
jgi:hypothetical protein